MTVEEQLKQLTDKYAGKRVRIKPSSKNIHAGEFAEVICYEMDPFGEPGMKVKNESGLEYYIYSAKDYFVIQEIEPVRTGHKIGRNDICFCMSGKKYKQCHGKN